MHNTLVCVIRWGRKRPSLAPFHSIESGDTFFVKGNAIKALSAAHYSGDASYDGYLLYGSDDESYYPEDLDTDLEQLKRSMGLVQKGTPGIPGAEFTYKVRLYRGRKKASNELVIGFIHYSTWFLNGEPTHISYYIRPVGEGDAYEVDPETIGEYIGRRDNQRTAEHPQGRMMFPGDIVHHYNMPSVPTHFEECVIEWDEERLCWANRDLKTGKLYTISNECVYIVVGTIYDRKHKRSKQYETG